MKKLSILLIVLLGASSLCYTPMLTGKTIIYIVRHAEKDMSDPKNQDPDLSAEGKDRAQALKHVLKNKKLGAVFSTIYRRTKQTGVYVAQNSGVPVKIYDPKDFKGIVEIVNTQYKSLNVIIIGHSNTVLELIEAFGAKRPVAKLTEDDYDLLFKLSIDKNGKVEIKTQRYGKQHHTTELPNQ